MTQQQAKEFWPLIKQWSEGGVLQHLRPAGWVDIDNPYFDDNITNYRIKPTPKLRPWRPEEVPVGALIRWRPETKHCYDGQRGFDICLIAGIHMYRILTSIHASNYTFDSCLKMHEHSLDHGKTWLPCGVMEET